jgi:predicted small lipoprotein YifL
MKSKNIRNVWIIVAVLSIAACGGKEPVSREDQQVAAFEDLRTAIVEVVSDESRRETVLGLAEEFEADVDALREILVQRRSDFRRLNADYDTDKEEFVRFANEMETRIQENQRRVFDGRAKLIQATTAEEWDALTKVDTKAMKSISKSIQGI